MEYPERVFKRKIYEKLLDWKKSKDGNTALLIRGARRVGKSTIAEEFAKREYASYIKVDFADAPEAVWEAVAHIADRDQFFLQLQFIYDVRLEPRKSVIIFDEIQKAPKVREAIKYLVKVFFIDGKDYPCQAERALLYAIFSGNTHKIITFR